MKSLHTWRFKLRALARRRAALRWCEALALSAAVVLACSLLVFAADYLFQASLVQRAILFAVAVGATGAGWWKWSAPLLAIHETSASLVLSVEEQHGMQNDLVAALQFEEHFAPAWGSVVLQQALVQRVAAMGERAAVLPEFRFQNALAPSAAAFAGLLIWCGLSIAAPEHCQVFLQRMLFLSVAYPTRTVLLEVVVVSGNVENTLISQGRIQRETARCLEGEPVTIRVRCAGEIPGAVTVSVFEEKTGQRRVLEAVRTASTYQVVLEQVLEPLQCEVVAGDARGGPFLLKISPPPAIEIAFHATPPAYAKDSSAAVVLQAARRLEVLPGSAVAISVACKNEKPLKKVLLQLKTSADSAQLEMIPQNDLRTLWKISAHPLLQEIEQETQLTWRIVDRDGMAPPSPVTAVIALIADQTPKVLAASSSQLVHAQARPTIVYELHDDFGIASAAVHVAIDRNGEVRKLEFSLPENQAARSPLAFPLSAENLPYRGRWSLDLEPLQVQRGDEIRLRVVAHDNRGATEGEAGESSPVIWRVAEREEVIRSILQADAATEKTLLELIDLQRSRLEMENAP